MAVNDLITFRKGTASQWTSVNPVLASGEPGYDLTNNILKIGDGSTAWNSLSNHKHTASNITDFNSSVSGLLPVKDIIAGSNIIITSNSGNYTINSTGSSGGSGGLAASSYVTQGKLNSNQSIPRASDTLIDFVDDYDPQNWWNPTTHKFQPNVAGYYLVSLGVWWDSADISTDQNNAQVRLNGNTVMILQDILHGSVGQSQTGNKMVYMNGTTDYLEFTVFTADTNGQNLQYGGSSSGNGTWFTAVLLAYSGQPTVTNYGSNRVLISDNTTTGMSAQSNLTFDGSTLTAPSGSFSNSLKLNNVNVSISGHGHIIGDISGLQSALDGKQASGSYAASSHTHTSSNITDFNTSVSGLLPVKNIVAGDNITISSVSGIYTINSTGGGSSSSNVGVRGVISTTGNLSSFAVSGGYPVGYLDLFQDGVKLVSSLDFSATDGSNVTLSNSVPSGTVLEYLTMASGVTSGGGSTSLPSNISGTLSVDGDSSYGSVVLLLHGNAFTDSSSYNRTVTSYGGVAATGTAKYGVSSYSLSSVGDYLGVPSSTAFSFGTGDFTLEAWIRPTNYPQDNAGAYVSTIFGRQQSGDHCFRFDINGTSSSLTGLTFVGFPDNGNGSSLSANYSFSLNTWYHIAVSRISGILYLFVNGTLLNSGGTSFTTTIKDSSNEMRIGALNFDSTYKFQFFGLIADARITKGIGRYSSTFTAPTSEFPNSTPYTLSAVNLAVSGGSGTGSSGSGSSTYDSRWDLFLPPAPTGVSVSAGNTQATVSWTAPTVLSQTPITDYIVQYSSNSGSTWTTFSDGVSTSASSTVTGLNNGTSYVFRVAAVNGIGTGSYSSASSSVTPSNFQPSAVLLTSGTSYTVPSGASTMKAWVVGAGGSAGAFLGNAGAVAYKTWSVSPGDSVSYSLGANSTYYSRSNTTLTYNGTTISAQSGSGSDWNGNEAATHSGGDGGANGGLHGYPSGSGGSGGAVGGNSGPASCGRYTATDVSGLFAAVVLAGGSVTESCGATAAFGSGGTVNAALNAGIGGGGAYYYAGQESTVGGPSAVVLYFS